MAKKSMIARETKRKYKVREINRDGSDCAGFVSVNWHSMGRFPELSNHLGRLDGG
jgi:hypothetical protein